MPANTYQWVQYAFISFGCGIPLGFLLGFAFGIVSRVKRFFAHDKSLLDV